MMLFYIDESCTSLKHDASPYFVLAALAVPANTAGRLDAKVSTLKRSILNSVEPEDFEIKGRDIRQGAKFFKRLSWEARLDAIRQIANLVVDLDLNSYVVQVDKREVVRKDMNDSDLYRVAFFRLLDELNRVLEQCDKPGLLMMDSRSDHHTAVQDRRIVDAYLRWIPIHSAHRFVERPWFGFSAFYPGLQLADFIAHMVAVVHDDVPDARSVAELAQVFRPLETTLKLLRIP